MCNISQHQQHKVTKKRAQTDETNRSEKKQKANEPYMDKTSKADRKASSKKKKAKQTDPGGHKKTDIWTVNQTKDS